ncbi:endoplasmic reticulum membrane sensor NFE2L1-like [Xenentodon cancila]
MQWQHDVLETQNQSDLEPVLLPLTPSAQLDDQSPVQSSSTALKNCNLGILPTPTTSTEDHSEDFFMGVNMDNNWTGLDVNLLAPDVSDRREPESLSGVNVHSNEPTTSSLIPTQDLLVSPSSPSLLDQEVEDLPQLLSELLEDATILDDFRLLDLDLDLEEGFSPEMVARLEEEGYLESPDKDGDFFKDQEDAEDEVDSDSGLSLDYSRSPASSSVSEGSSNYLSSSSSAASSPASVGTVFSNDEDAEEDVAGPGTDLKVTIKQEALEEEEMGAVGGSPGDVSLFSSNSGDHKLFHGLTWLEHIGHDHTYNQPGTRWRKPDLGHENAKPYHDSSSLTSDTKLWSQDERQAQVLNIPLSNELIVHLPVEEFNNLLSNYQLSEEQLALVRDIRRRGKNKIAAQNCRKRKQDAVLGLEDDVSGLRRRRSKLLREKRETLRHLQDMKRSFGMLYQETFSKLRDKEGRPLNATEYMLQFGPDDDITVASVRVHKSSRKQKK